MNSIETSTLVTKANVVTHVHSKVLLALLALFLAAAFDASADDFGLITVKKNEKRTVVVQQDDLFWITTNESGSQLEVMPGHKSLKTQIGVPGDKIPLQYPKPGSYRVRVFVDGQLITSDIKVKVLRNTLRPKKGQDYAEQARSSKYSVGSVWAGGNTFCVRVVGSGSYELQPYGSGKVTPAITGHLGASGEHIWIVETTQKQVTIIKKPTGGTHVLAVGSPYVLKINDIKFIHGVSSVKPQDSVGKKTFKVPVKETFALEVVPGPNWVAKAGKDADRLFYWGPDEETGLTREFVYEKEVTEEIRVNCPTHYEGVTTTVEAVELKNFKVCDRLKDNSCVGKNGVLVVTSIDLSGYIKVDADPKESFLKWRVTDRGGNIVSDGDGTELPSDVTITARDPENLSYKVEVGFGPEFKLKQSVSVVFAQKHEDPTGTLIVKSGAVKCADKKYIVAPGKTVRLAAIDLKDKDMQGNEVVDDEVEAKLDSEVDWAEAGENEWTWTAPLAVNKENGCITVTLALKDKGYIVQDYDDFYSVPGQSIQIAVYELKDVRSDVEKLKQFMAGERVFFDPVFIGCDDFVEYRYELWSVDNCSDAPSYLNKIDESNSGSFTLARPNHYRVKLYSCADAYAEPVESGVFTRARITISETNWSVNWDNGEVSGMNADAKALAEYEKYTSITSEAAQLTVTVVNLTKDSHMLAEEAYEKKRVEDSKQIEIRQANKDAAEEVLKIKEENFEKAIQTLKEFENANNADAVFKQVVEERNVVKNIFNNIEAQKNIIHGIELEIIGLGSNPEPTDLARLNAALSNERAKLLQLEDLFRTASDKLKALESAYDFILKTLAQLTDALNAADATRKTANNALNIATDVLKESQFIYEKTLKFKPELDSGFKQMVAAWSNPRSMPYGPNISTGTAKVFSVLDGLGILGDAVQLVQSINTLRNTTSVRDEIALEAAKLESIAQDYHDALTSLVGYRTIREIQKLDFVVKSEPGCVPFVLDQIEIKRLTFDSELAGEDEHGHPNPLPYEGDEHLVMLPEETKSWGDRFKTDASGSLTFKLALYGNLGSATVVIGLPKDGDSSGDANGYEIYERVYVTSKGLTEEEALLLAQAKQRSDYERVKLRNENLAVGEAIVGAVMSGAGLALFFGLTPPCPPCAIGLAALGIASMIVFNAVEAELASETSALLQSIRRNFPGSTHTPPKKDSR